MTKDSMAFLLIFRGGSPRSQRVFVGCGVRTSTSRGYAESPVSSRAPLPDVERRRPSFWRRYPGLQRSWSAITRLPTTAVGRQGRRLQLGVKLVKATDSKVWKQQVAGNTQCIRVRHGEKVDREIRDVGCGDVWTKARQWKSRALCGNL